MSSITRLPSVANSIVNPMTNHPPIPWADDMAIIAKNDNTSTLVTVAFDTSDYLVCKGFDFSSIPDNATIDGISIEYLIQATDMSASPYPTLWYNNSTLGTVPTNPSLSSTDWTNMIVGNPTSKWVEDGLTTAIVKNSGFGVALSVSAAPPSNTVSINWLEMTVYYTAIGGDIVSVPSAIIPAVIPAKIPAIIPSVI